MIWFVTKQGLNACRVVVHLPLFKLLVVFEVWNRHDLGPKYLIFRRCLVSCCLIGGLVVVVVALAIRTLNLVVIS